MFQTEDRRPQVVESLGNHDPVDFVRYAAVVVVAVAVAVRP
ncbi:hypothetical protein [Micromonospora sp. Llam0]|nr:hypothetical protein [Micromonospora sp. Llam0]